MILFKSTYYFVKKDKSIFDPTINYIKRSLLGNVYHTTDERDLIHSHLPEIILYNIQSVAGKSFKKFGFFYSKTYCLQK